jgi:hypothetical protein
LALVQAFVALWVVAHEDLTERRVERLDVLRKVLAIFEIELVLATLLGGGSGDVPALRGIPQNGGAELLIDEMPARSFATPPATAAFKPS